jgi:hypothetical protein
MPGITGEVIKQGKRGTNREGVCGGEQPPMPLTEQDTQAIIASWIGSPKQVQIERWND